MCMTSRRLRDGDSSHPIWWNGPAFSEVSPAEKNGDGIVTQIAGLSFCTDLDTGYLLWFCYTLFDCHCVSRTGYLLRIQQTDLTYPDNFNRYPPPRPNHPRDEKMSPSVNLNGADTSAGPLTVDGIADLRAKSAPIPTGVAPATSSDMFKSPVSTFGWRLCEWC